MTEPRVHHPIVRNRKKSRVPLSKLRTSDVVKTVVDNPRRLEELLRMLEDKDRGIRGRAAIILAQLSESHPARLLRVSARLREALVDESAYVRWHLIYTLGKIGARFPGRARGYLGDLVSRLEDDNRICRVLACRALGQVGVKKRLIIEECFRNLKKEIPSSLSRILRNS